MKSRGIEPKLATILVGDDHASKAYVASKHKACLEVGVTSENHTLPSSTDESSLSGLIENLNRNESVHGILLQLPLPKQLDVYKMIERIAPNKDVDGLTSRNMGLLVYGKPQLVPCTPKGVITLLKFYKIDLKGRPTVIINRSHLVGKPLAHLMMAEDSTVTVCHSKSNDLHGIMREAEILISAVGKRPGFTVTADSVR
ncbi:MAG: bifunctional 5,10-methylenetetrahydrofolate dehydrogenase/5,10-methenyltetrahydrofolate cyclohydrolase, partial [Candidatus Bathyarchaeia archaeon]